MGHQVELVSEGLETWTRDIPHEPDVAKLEEVHVVRVPELLYIGD